MTLRLFTLCNAHEERRDQFEVAGIDELLPRIENGKHQLDEAPEVPRANVTSASNSARSAWAHEPSFASLRGEAARLSCILPIRSCAALRLLRLQMREARQHSAHRVVIGRCAKGKVCGLVLRRRVGRLRRVCASPRRTSRAAAMSPSIADWSSLRTIASCLVIVSTVSPRLTFTRRAASFMKISPGVG